MSYSGSVSRKKSAETLGPSEGCKSSRESNGVILPEEKEKISRKKQTNGYFQDRL